MRYWAIIFKDKASEKFAPFLSLGTKGIITSISIYQSSLIIQTAKVGYKFRAHESLCHSLSHPYHTQSLVKMVWIYIFT